MEWLLENLTRSPPVPLSMSHYRIKEDCSKQDCQVKDRSNLQSKTIREP